MERNTLIDIAHRWNKGDGKRSMAGGGENNGEEEKEERGIEQWS